MPTSWTRCPWDSWPQCSRIPLCLACHPHPQVWSIGTPRTSTGIWKPCGLQSTKMIEQSTVQLEFNLSISCSQGFSGWLLGWGRFEPGIIRLDQWHATDIWLLFFANHTPQIAQTGKRRIGSGRLQPTYLWSARKVSYVFKHSVSTCSNTCAEIQCYSVSQMTDPTA